MTTTVNGVSSRSNVPYADNASSCTHHIPPIAVFSSKRNIVIPAAEWEKELLGGNANANRLLRPPSLSSPYSVGVPVNGSFLLFFFSCGRSLCC